MKLLHINPILLTPLVSAISICVLFAQTSSAEQVGAEIFNSKCSGCHTIGKGALVGPDLAAGKSWTENNLDAGIRRMQASVGSLSDEQIEQLKIYLKSTADSKEPAGENEEKSELKPDLSEKVTGQTIDLKGGNALLGANLFHGRQAFQNGGMSCNACHTVNGSSGLLGSDLSNIGSKMNESALFSACKQTPFKIMKAAYAKHPISEQEALDLVKYFQSLPKETKKPMPLALCAGAGSIVILLLLALGYRNRNSAVRKKLHRR